MIHPATQLQWISEEIGFGVITTEDLPMGTITVVRDPLDLVMTRDEVECLPEVLRTRVWHFMYVDTSSRFILSWDHARYINHSCEANTMLTEFGVEVAVRDIKKGEELTSEYGLLRAQEELKHSCQVDSCRGIVGLNDFELYQDQWSLKLQIALKQAQHIPQALAPLFNHTTFSF